MTEVQLDPQWSVGDKLFGGYLLRTAAEAALTPEHPHVMSVSAQFLSAPAPGPAEVLVEPLRAGRRVSFSRVRLLSGGSVAVEALVSATRYPPDSTPWWTSPRASAPHLARLEDCPRAPSVRSDGVPVGFLERIDMRPDPRTAAYASGSPTGHGETRAWLHLDPGPALDPLDLLVLCDALPPTTFDLGLVGWVPTVEMTVHVRGLPAPGWCRAVQRSVLLQDGWLDEDCEVWDSAGRLVAQSRQLAGFRAEPGQLPVPLQA